MSRKPRGVKQEYDYLKEKIIDPEENSSENQHKQINFILETLIRNYRLQVTRDPESFDEKSTRIFAQLVKCRLDIDKYIKETDRDIARKINGLPTKELEELAEQAKELSYGNEFKKNGLSD